MPELLKKLRLKKELRLFDVYAIATGTTLSAGFFLLPGIAAQQAGTAMIFSYIIAAIPLVPAMFSVAELATAMPRAGGVYYFLDRSLGPLFGTVGGIGTWLALILKVAFALIGMGAYLELFFPNLPIILIAILFALAIGLLNLFGTKKSGKFQIILVIGLLAILTVFIGRGIPEIQSLHFKDIFSNDLKSIFSTAGLVYISYVGVTKVASLSEEIKNPERNIPRGIFLALGSAFVIYVLGTVVMVGVIPIEKLSGDLTPVATAADIIFGKVGTIFVTIAALMAFLSVANAGTLSASRYPLAMSRDHMLPRLFQKIGSQGTPFVAIILTVAIIILILLIFDPAKIAKLASAFQLLMFGFVSLAVIIMRESKIDSYDPGYRSPFYPYLQIVGILAPIWLIIEMGFLPIVFTVGLVLIGSAWYWFYAKERVIRNGAIYHIFERLGRSRYGGLDSELRGILKEKGLREEDPFDLIVARSFVIDLDKSVDFEYVVNKASQWLAQFVQHSSNELEREFLEGTRIGATPVTHNIALPHLRMKGFQHPEMVLVRSKKGIEIVLNNPLTDFQEKREIVNAVFFLVSPESNPAQHLRILAQIASRVDEDSFALDWQLAKDEQDIKEALLHDERYLSLVITRSDQTAPLIDKTISNMNIPEGCLVTWIRRGELVIIAHGDTFLQEGDQLTIIGEQNGIKELRKKYIEK
ncbi:MAG TPA: amino acid permease [Ignavibacteriaceae bacterium]|nr:amino acid permease [Ignavibacteriaceae bacterium]